MSDYCQECQEPTGRTECPACWPKELVSTAAYRQLYVRLAEAQPGFYLMVEWLKVGWVWRSLTHGDWRVSAPQGCMCWVTCSPHRNEAIELYLRVHFGKSARLVAP